MDPSIFLYSLFGPFILWPIEHLLPYPYIFEELYKYFAIAQSKELDEKTVVFSGVLFAATETVLYTINVNILSSLSYMGIRFITTSILHSVTFLIMYYFYKRKLRGIGLLLAMTVHFLYNKFI